MVIRKLASLLLILAVHTMTNVCATESSIGAEALLPEQSFYPRPSFTAPIKANQQKDMAAEYKYYFHKQPEPGLTRSHLQLPPFQSYTFQHQTPGVIERKAVKTVVGLSVVGGILLGKMIGLFLKPALIWTALKRIFKSVKAPVIQVTSNARLLSEQEELPPWVRSVFSAIDNLAALSNQSTKVN